MCGKRAPKNARRTSTGSPEIFVSRAKRPESRAHGLYFYGRVERNATAAAMSSRNNWQFIWPLSESFAHHRQVSQKQSAPNSILPSTSTRHFHANCAATTLSNVTALRARVDNKTVTPVAHIHLALIYVHAFKFECHSHVILAAALFVHVRSIRTVVVSYAEVVKLSLRT